MCNVAYWFLRVKTLLNVNLFVIIKCCKVVLFVCTLNQALQCARSVAWRQVHTAATDVWVCVFSYVRKMCLCSVGITIRFNFKNNSQCISIFDFPFLFLLYDHLYNNIVINISSKFVIYADIWRMLFGERNQAFPDYIYNIWYLNYIKFHLWKEKKKKTPLSTSCFLISVHCFSHFIIHIMCDYMQVTSLVKK